MARLRANRSLVEVGSDQLAMERAEARALLRGAGVDLTESAIETLVEHTEGWPVGLYLAALAVKAGSREVGVERTFTGDDRFMGDYLRTEILDRVSRTDATFLARTSILERLCGPLCDATVATKGSGRLLDRLARDNKLVIPLDRRGEWYRYHHLFRDLLRAELERREPETISELHGRAARWYQDHGYLEAAIDHAQLAADVDRVAELVLQVANPVWSSGRLETVLRWMEWFPANGRIEEHPAIALHGALIHALIGRAGDAERWANAAHRTTFDGVLSDGNSMAGSLAYLRALMCRDGFDTMSRDADAALQGLSPTSPYRAAMLHALGVAHLARLDLDAADRCFMSALDEARSAGIVPFIPVLLTERGIVASERGHGVEAEGLARDALAMMTGGRYDDYWTSALVYAWCGHLAAQRGDLEDGRRLAADAARLRPLLTYALPVVSVQALLELARAYLALADSGGARAALRQVRDILARCPDLGSFPASAHHLQATVETLRDDIVGASSLTAAEFRLVPLLSTHLTYPEIGERLFISRHTVKSQAGSVYRKLGVASRSEAIARLQQLGLAPVQDVAGGPLA
jgi:LuxR family maltose regulon positive regulatory protein